MTCQERINSAAMKTYVKERRANHFEHLFNNTAEIFRTARKIDTTLSKFHNLIFILRYSSSLHASLLGSLLLYYSLYLLVVFFVSYIYFRCEQLLKRMTRQMIQ